MSDKKNCNPLESVETHKKYYVDNPLRNNSTEKSMIQKKKIMLHKTKEHATDVIPNPIVESWRKEFRKEFGFIGHKGIQCDEITVANLEAFISSQIQQAEERLVERIIKELITIRDTEMEGRKDLMKSSAGYNVNLLIEELATLKEEK